MRPSRLAILAIATPPWLYGRGRVPVTVQTPSLRVATRAIRTGIPFFDHMLQGAAQGEYGRPGCDDSE